MGKAMNDYSSSNPIIPPDLPKECIAGLQPGEKLIWAGQPAQFRWMRIVLWSLLLPISLWLTGATLELFGQKSSEFVSMLGGFALLNIGMFAIRSYLHDRERIGTWYLLTNLRVRQYAPHLSRFQELPLESLGPFTMHFFADRSGSIGFGEGQLFYGRRVFNLDWTYNPEFCRIQNPQAVRELLGEAVAAAKAATSGNA